MHPYIEDGTEVYAIDGLKVEKHIWKNTEARGPENTELVFQLCGYEYGRDWFINREDANLEIVRRIGKVK